MKILNKIYLIFFFIQLFSATVFSQNKIKHHVVSAGIGVLSAQQFFYPFQSEYLDCYKMKTTSLYHLKYAYQFKIEKDFFLSLGINYANFSYNDFYVRRFISGSNISRDTIRLKFNSTSTLLSINLNFDIEKEFTLYGGVGIGKRTQKITNATISYVDSIGNYNVEIGMPEKNPMPIGLEATIGCRYYFLNNFGAFGELGLAKSLLQLGLTYRF